MRYADFKNDFAFVKLFGANEDVLRALLNDYAVVPIKSGRRRRIAKRGGAK